MPLREDLLTPIAGALPAGVELRYEPVYDKIKEARREDDDIPSGGYDRPRKLADWPQVIKLAQDAIATQSKDLQLAAWLTEALLRREGYAGLAQGCRLMLGITEQFWDGCWPAIEDNDLDMRAAPIQWVGTKLTAATCMVPLVASGGLHYFHYKESRAIPTEQEAEGDDGKLSVRRVAEEEGKTLPEVFDKAFAATKKEWYRTLAADVALAIEATQALKTKSDERFGRDGPNLLPLVQALEDVRVTVTQLFDRKLALEPDAVAATDGGDASASVDGATVASAGGSAAASGAPARGGAVAAEPQDAADAMRRVVSAAHFLRRADPTSPTSYLLLRGLRWGELRAAGGAIDPLLLEAPPASERSRLKKLQLEGKWLELRDGVEAVMGTPAGRGWLDLQRYLLEAFDGLGDEYAAAGRAVRGALRGLLQDVPGLADSELLDEMPAASKQTLAWLTDHALLPGADGNGAGDDAVEAAPRPVRTATLPSSMATDRLLDSAMAEVRAGRSDGAIAMVNREIARETTERGKFLRQVVLARVLVESGLAPVAVPTLQRLLGLIDTHKLDAWEGGPVVAEPMVLLHRALRAAEGDAEQLQALYLRVCELDPMAAIALDRSDASSSAGYGETSSGEGE